MSGATIAALDVGTNTTLLLLARGGPDGSIEVLAERAEVTRLGRGIGEDGRLRPDNVARTLAVLRDWAALARDRGARVVAAGTEALRRAPNAADFLLPARAILDAPVEVIDGEREAALTFLATCRAFPRELAAGRSLTVDIGGGSTELIVAEGDAAAARPGGGSAPTLRMRRSLPLGSVRLTEQFLRADPPDPRELAALRDHVRALLSGLPLRADVVVGTAGTVTSLAALALDLDSYDAARVHGSRLTQEQLARQVATLSPLPLAERQRLPGLDPRRADVIVAGAWLLAEIVGLAGAPACLVSDRGVRWGLLHEALGQGLAT